MFQLRIALWLPQPGLRGPTPGADLHDELHLLHALHSSGEIYHSLPSFLQGETLMMPGCLYSGKGRNVKPGKISKNDLLDSHLPSHYYCDRL